MHSAWMNIAVIGGLVAVSGCPTIELGEEPESPTLCRPNQAYYQDVIWPDFIEIAGNDAASCTAAAGCHDIADGRSALRLSTAAPIDHDQNYRIVIRYLNCADPGSSSMLTKPMTGIDAHGGGDLFNQTDMPRDIFLQWFNM